VVVVVVVVVVVTVMSCRGEDPRLEWLGSQVPVLVSARRFVDAETVRLRHPSVHVPGMGGNARCKQASKPTTVLGGNPPSPSGGRWGGCSLGCRQ